MNPSPGWYQDPHDHTKERYFSGNAWTSHVRNDVPKIPLAPWVDQSQHILTGGVLHDANPPVSGRRTWAAVAVAACGVAIVTVVGVVVTLNGLGV